MKFSTVQRIAKKIIQQSERGESTVVFLGAGASVSSGIPTTSGIIEYIKNKENSNSFINSDSSNYFEVMEELDSGERRRVLNHFIDKSKVNITHLVSAFLMKIGLVDCIITTNFDPLMKRSLSLLNCRNQIYDVANNVDLTGFTLSFPSVIYLHGEYRNVWQFNTKPELKKRSRDIRSIIDKIGTHRSWLVIGYSGNDFVVDELIKLEKFDERLFWVGFNNDEPVDKVKSKLLSKPEKNAYYISGYDSDSFFNELLTEIKSLKSLELGEALEKLQLSFKNHEQFEERLKVTSALKFELSEVCEKWIDRTILESTLQKEQEIRHSTFWEKLLHIFTIESHYYKAKEFIRKDNPSAALLEINKLIENEIDGPISYYYKGIALGLQAEETENPEESIVLYERTKEAFSRAKVLSNSTGRTPAEVKNIDAVLESFWRKEHNNAIKYVTDDSMMKKVEKPLDMSIAHLQNAITIQPGRPLSWNVLALIQNRRKEFGEAAKAQQKYLNIKNKVSAKDYLLLAQFYRMDDQMQKSIDALEAGHEKFPDSTRIVENLADSYSQTDQSDQAISIVEDLVKQDPTNPQYHLSLGTQIYKLALKYQNQLNSNNDKIFNLQQQIRKAQGSGDNFDDLQNQTNQLKEKKNKIEGKIENLSNCAVDQLNETLKYRQNDKVAFNTLGIIYQNKAKDYFDKRNMTMDNMQAQQFDAKAKELLHKSRKNYEKAADIDPDNPKYWRSLMHVYKALDMDGKAEEANQKF